MAKSLNDLIPSDDDVEAALPDLERLERRLHADLRAQGLDHLASMIAPVENIEPPSPGAIAPSSQTTDYTMPGQVFYNDPTPQQPPTPEATPEAAPEPDPTPEPRPEQPPVDETQTIEPSDLPEVYRTQNLTQASPVEQPNTQQQGAPFAGPVDEVPPRTIEQPQAETNPPPPRAGEPAFDSLSPEEQRLVQSIRQEIAGDTQPQDQGTTRPLEEGAEARTEASSVSELVQALQDNTEQLRQLNAYYETAETAESGEGVVFDG